MLKTISGHRVPTDWRFTSTITITVTYQRKGVRVQRYFHSVGLGEGKENPHVCNNLRMPILMVVDYTELDRKLRRAL